MNPNADSTPADRLLRQHYRWMRNAWPLVILAAGLATTLIVDWRWHPSWAQIEHWGNLPQWWAAGVGLTLIAALGAWIFRRKSLLHSAQRLDARLDAKNRLETAAALRADAGPLARAQREETAGFLKVHQPATQPHRAPLLALSALAALLTLAHLVTLASWTRPWNPRVVKTAVAPKPTAPTLPKARIQWKTPQSETKAAPIEEVPLEAVADSTSGLRDAVLEMSVNGEPRLSAPMALDELKAAGQHSIKTSIYLDQLEVQPYDIVSYYLRAQRVDSRKLPETVSPVQFVQIKPFRDDIREAPGGNGNAVLLYQIKALKVAQLRLIKENFVLAHAELGQENTDWKKENARVGSEQDALEKKTGEMLQQMITSGEPAEIVNLVTQAKPFMADAAKKIQAAANQPAVTPQGKALGLITEVEKFYIRIVARGGKGKPQPTVSDPFRDKQEFEMKQRFKTPAGELEMLAAEQARLAEDLSKPDAASAPAPSPADTSKPLDPSKIDGTPAGRQTQISQRVGAMLNGSTFAKEVAQHLEQGRDQARDALHQLDAQDTAAAREPAASAARELRLAAEAMNRAGEQQEKQQLADAQRALNEAAEQARGAARQGSEDAAKQSAEEAEKKARETARQLAEDAKAQQETGSGQSAARINELAKSLSAEDMRKALERLRAQPRDVARAQDAGDRLQQMADRVAQARNQGPLSQEELARLVERMERARANMQRIAANGQGAPPGEAKTGQPGQQGKGEQGQGAQPGEGKGSGPGKGDGPGAGNSGNYLGDTHGGATGELSGGPVPVAPPPPNAPPVYTDHASRPLQPRDPDAKEQFARALVEEVRESAQDAAAILPKADALNEVREALSDAVETHYADMPALYAKINPPLEGLISLLRAEVQQGARRQHQLIGLNLDLAPPAYRPAVADYFEQLSRDYDAAPEEAKKE